MGIITLEDVIEELIGEEIVDETDQYVDVHRRITVAKARLQYHRQSVSAPSDITRTRRRKKRVDRSKSHPALLSRQQSVDGNGSINSTIVDFEVCVRVCVWACVWVCVRVGGWLCMCVDSFLVRNNLSGI